MRSLTTIPTSKIHRLTRLAITSIGHWLPLFAVALLIGSTTSLSASLYSEDFESVQANQNATDWIDTGASNSMTTQDSLFAVMELDDNKAWGTSSQLGNIHSHYNSLNNQVMGGYEFSGRIMMSDSESGIGVTFFSDYPESDTYYRLRRYDGARTFHLAEHGSSLSGDLDTGVDPLANEWYRFHIRVEVKDDQTDVSAKVWLDGDQEPMDWQASAVSNGSDRLTEGTIGVWSHEVGSKYWDDFSVTLLDEGSSVTVPNLAGLIQAEAEGSLNALGLNLGVVSYRIDSSVAVGTVLEQTPDAASSVENGATVSMVVSTAPDSNPVGTSRISLSWTDNSTNEVGFEVERKELGDSFDAIATVGQDVLAFSDTDVIPGLEYQYRVRAFNEFGYSGYTNVVTETLVNTAPQIVSLNGVSGLGSLELNFQRGEDIGVVSIEIEDAETDVADLVFEVTPFNAEVVPFESLDYSVEGNVVTLSIDTFLTQIGSSDVSFVVSDGVGVAEAVLSLTIDANNAPRISSLGSHSIYDGQTSGPHSFTIIDDDTSAEDLIVTVSSSDESLVPSSSISLSGSGYERAVTVSVPLGASGTVVIRVHVDDGYTQKTAAFPLSITFDNAPQVSGFASSYEIPYGGRISDIPFVVSDIDQGASNLDISFSSNNTLLFPPALSTISGSGSGRTLNIVPSRIEHGFATICVTVSDGIKSTRSEPIFVTVVPPVVSMKLISFRVENGLPVAEVESQPGVTFTLLRSYSLAADSWETVENVDVIVGESTTMLMDLSLVSEPVYYRVVASE